MMMTMMTTTLMMRSMVMALMMIYDGHTHDEKQGGTWRLVIGDYRCGHFTRSPLPSRPVFHPEPPAIIPPEEAQVFVDVQEAGLISRMIDKTMDSDHQSDPGRDPILLGRASWQQLSWFSFVLLVSAPETWTGLSHHLSLQALEAQHRPTTFEIQGSTCVSSVCWGESNAPWFPCSPSWIKFIETVQESSWRTKPSYTNGRRCASVHQAGSISGSLQSCSTVDSDIESVGHHFCFLLWVLAGWSLRQLQWARMLVTLSKEACGQQRRGFAEPEFRFRTREQREQLRGVHGLCASKFFGLYANQSYGYGCCNSINNRSSRSKPSTGRSAYQRRTVTSVRTPLILEEPEL